MIKATYMLLYIYTAFSSMWSLNSKPIGRFLCEATLKMHIIKITVYKEKAAIAQLED